MKLVELLARHYDKWPEGIHQICQSAHDTELYVEPNAGYDRQDHLVDWWADDAGLLNYVDEAQWQAERDKQNGGEWKRHRGGKQPVADDVRVEVKLRDGDIQEARARAFLWHHNQCDSYANIMQFRVISQPKAEEIPMIADGDTREYKGPFPCSPIGEAVNSLEWDIEFPQGVFHMEAKTGQIDGPILWRNTVNELDAYIEEFTRERESLINRLAEEGFALIPAITAVMGVADVDMGDWRNWKVGDKIRMTARDWCDLTKGAAYEIIDTGDDYITIIDDVDYRRSLEVDDETMFEHGRLMDFEFVSSP